MKYTIANRVKRALEKYKNKKPKPSLEERRKKLKHYQKEWMRNWRINNPEKNKIERERQKENRIKRMGVENYLKYQNNQSNKYRNNNPIKIKSRKVVFVNIRNGKIKKNPCIICGSGKSEAHHENYSKPLNIEWLCKKHHIMADRELKKKDHDLTKASKK